jgi:hypothetical protein
VNTKRTRNSGSEKKRKPRKNAQDEMKGRLEGPQERTDEPEDEPGEFTHREEIKILKLKG